MYLVKLSSNFGFAVGQWVECEFNFDTSIIKMTFANIDWTPERSGTLLIHTDMVEFALQADYSCGLYVSFFRPLAVYQLNFRSC